MEQNIPARIYRHEEPTMHDTAPYGTECKVFHYKVFDIYLQLGANEEFPRWVLIGSYHHDTPEELLEEDINHILEQLN